MPRKATDYSTTPVSFYHFVCNNPEIKCGYIGHTINFIKRRNAHKTKCHNPNSPIRNINLYVTIRENGGWENWRMIELEKKICVDARDAERVEQEWIDKTTANLNMLRAFNSEEHEKERLSKYQKEYREKNIQHLKEYLKNYNLGNKEILAEKSKNWRLINSEKLAEKRKEPFECECGSKMCIFEKSRHLKTKKHQELMNSKA